MASGDFQWFVGLDIDDGRAVHHIHMFYRQHTPLNPYQLQDGHADGVGPVGRTEAEYAFDRSGALALLQKFIALRAMEMKENHDMFMLFKAIQSLDEGFIDLNGAGYIRDGIEVGRILGLLDGAVQDTDRRKSHNATNFNSSVFCVK